MRFQMFSCGAILYNTINEGQRRMPGPAHPFGDGAEQYQLEINGIRGVDNPPPGFLGPTARRYLRLDLRIGIELGEERGS